MQKRLKEITETQSFIIRHYIDDDTGNEWEDHQVRSFIPFEALIMPGLLVEYELDNNSADGRKP